MTAAEEFTEFATGAAPRLRRTAFLLCGNWHTAEDLAQTTLVKMFVSWGRISRQDAVYAYANRTLVSPRWKRPRCGKCSSVRPPPIGPVARNAVRADVKRRRRRRVAGAAAILAVPAAVFVTIPAVTGTRSTPAPATGTIPATVWVANYPGARSW